MCLLYFQDYFQDYNVVLVLYQMWWLYYQDSNVFTVLYEMWWLYYQEYNVVLVLYQMWWLYYQDYNATTNYTPVSADINLPPKNLSQSGVFRVNFGFDRFMVDDTQ